jgi:hypothetical protein
MFEPGFASRALLAALLLCIEGTAIFRALNFLNSRAERVQPPLQLAALSNEVRRVARPGTDGEDGLFVTDRLLAINGERFTGHAQWAAAVQSAKPGDVWGLEVEHYPPGSSVWRETVTQQALRSLHAGAFLVVWLHCLAVVQRFSRRCGFAAG